MKSIVKISVYGAVNAVNVLDSISNSKYQGLTSLHVFRVRKALYEYKEFLIEETNKIIDEYSAVPDENGNFIVKTNDVIDEEKSKEFVSKVMDVRKQEIEIEIQKFSLDEISCFDLTPSDIASLDPFIEDDK